MQRLNKYTVIIAAKFKSGNRFWATWCRAVKWAALFVNGKKHIPSAPTTPDGNKANSDYLVNATVAPLQL